MGWNIIFNWCNLSYILSRKDIYLLQNRLILSNITYDICDIVGAVHFLIRVREESPELWWMWSEDTAFVCLRARSVVCPPLTPGESFIYGGPWATALWCTAFPSRALIGVGSWISFLAFSCKSILIPKHESELSGQLWRKPGAFGRCPAPRSAQVTVLDLQLWQSLPMVQIREVNKFRSLQTSCVPSLLQTLSLPVQGEGCFSFSRLNTPGAQAGRSGWPCVVWLPQVPHTPLPACLDSSCKILDRKFFRTEVFCIIWALWLLMAAPGRMKYSFVGVTNHKTCTGDWLFCGWSDLCLALCWKFFLVLVRLLQHEMSHLKVCSLFLGN